MLYAVSVDHEIPTGELTIPREHPDSITQKGFLVS